MVEFVLVLPVFLTMFFGVIQLGLIYASYQLTYYAAFRAARAAIVADQDRDAVAMDSAQRVLGIMKGGNLTVTLGGDDAVVSATVSFDLPMTMPFAGRVLGRGGRTFRISETCALNVVPQ